MNYIYSKIVLIYLNVIYPIASQLGLK